MLTSAQLTALATDINANPAFAAIPHTADGAYEIAAAYDVVQPAYIVWKTNVTNEEILRNGMDWTRVDNLSVGKSRIWEWMMQFGNFNPSKPNIRAGIDAVWVGTAADLAVRAAVYVHCKRAATRAEKLFATGTGTDASPATMAVEGSISWMEVKTAMGW